MRNHPMKSAIRNWQETLQYTKRAFSLVLATSRGLSLALLGLSIIAGALPAAIAYTGKLIVDAVVASINADPNLATSTHVYEYILFEFALVGIMAFAQRGLMMCRSLLRAKLGHAVNVMILDKALALDLTHFEDPVLYDKMTRARREASSRPLSLVMRTFGIAQDGLSIATYGALLLSFSPWAVCLLGLGAIPSFVSELKFSQEAFRLSRWTTPETRQQMYLETVLAREDFAKEVKLLHLGPRLLARYENIFKDLWKADRNLTVRRGGWGLGLSLVSTGAFYGAYLWIVQKSLTRVITLGDMTMYVLVFKQGLSSLSSLLSAIGGVYEDRLYLSNLYEFLEEPVSPSTGQETAGKKPGSGLRFENVSYTYPGSDAPALEDITLDIPPGSKLALVGENGSGKTTLIKLMTRLYTPTKGRILLDGTPLEDWDLETLHRKIGVIFQDFVRYQLTVGENIGVGDEAAFDDRVRWRAAAEKGLADAFIDALPHAYDTQLGRWFQDGRELSIGQWQKIALSRAFMRAGAEILVLDEPTSAMDAEAEVKIFERFRALTENQIALLISHRFSTVRMADEIVVLKQGRILEQGSHEALIAANGHYAHLFALQAAGYA
jgi:ATP-binding cassette, subfamily B, bacterial